jgi:ABC-2 type transport system permease protein
MSKNNFYISTFLKDFKIALSYKLQFIFNFLSIFVSIFFIFIFSGLVDGAENSIMEKYGGSYFIFLFFGFLTAELSVLFLNTMPMKIREYQLTGIFEELMMSGRKENQIILSTLLYPTFFQFIRFGLYLLLFSFFEEATNFTSNLSVFSFLALLLFCVSLIGISLISTAFTVLFKSKGIINTLYLSCSSVLSGVAFPVELLPKFLIYLGEVLPTTQFLKITRSDLAGIIALEEVYLSLTIMFIMAVFLITLGITLLNKSIDISKRNGTLLTY